MTVDYKFRCQTRDEETPIGVLLRYLLDDALHPSATDRDMVLQAIRSFWIPFAYQALGTETVECQSYARSAVYQLQQHIFYIQSQFGLETEFSARTVSSSIVVPVANVAVQEATAQISDAMEIKSPSSPALVLPALDDDPFG